MRIWVDADACPRVIKDILFRAAERWRVELTLVANQPIRGLASPWVRTIQVERGFDVADDKIVTLSEPGDLVVTADIPLASKVIAKGALALDPRGELYTTQNIGERLDMRNFMDELRGAGGVTGGPAALGTAERRAFGNQLDRLLATQSKGR